MARKIKVYITLFLVLCLTIPACIMLVVASAVVKVGRAAIGDLVSVEGNRLYRLIQRLDDALARIDAALTICVRG